MDKIKIEILGDGTVKIETGKISGPIHLKTEQLLSDISDLLGGSTTIKRRTKVVDALEHEHIHE